jgi:rhodanese-related sulfurtransferase
MGNGGDMKKFAIVLFAVIMLLSACGISESITLDYRQITPVEAKEIMDGSEPYIILDVRPASQYDITHIEGSISIPVTEVETLAPQVLSDKDITILVYGCNGTRSGEASRALARMGYTNVLDFGGVRVWPYGGMVSE